MIKIILALSCSFPTMINKTKLPWNAVDIEHLTVAKKRCGELYKESPCVVKFYKKGKTDYSVICGKGT